jgi:hypothetical protein
MALRRNAMQVLGIPVAIACLLLVTGDSTAQSDGPVTDSRIHPVYTAPTPDAQRLAALDVIEKATVFLYADDKLSPGRPDPLATGFYIQIKSKTSNAYMQLIITARHVVEPRWIDCSVKTNPAGLLLRLNTLNYDPTKSETGVTLAGC